MMNQLQLAYPERPRARRTDPETSHAAARRAKHFADSHAGRILLALQLHGPSSARRLEQLIGLTLVQIDRRVSELRGMKLIRAQQDALGRVIQDSGCTVWEACR